MLNAWGEPLIKQFVQESITHAVLFRIDKFREQITGKHRLHEPDRPPSGHLAETQPRGETLDGKLAPEGGRCQMLSLSLRL
jgi:hypothetical protein